MTPRQETLVVLAVVLRKMVPPAPPTGYTVELIPGGDAVGYPAWLLKVILVDIQLDPISPVSTDSLGVVEVAVVPEEQDII